MDNTDANTSCYFFYLNSRYMRSLDGLDIIYEGDCPGQHVELFYHGCYYRLIQLYMFIDAKTSERHRGLQSSKELMQLQLIAAQLSNVLYLWRKVVANPARYNCNEGDPLICIHTIDVDICAALDTLKALERTADNMDIIAYKRLFVPVFRDEPCECDICDPDIELQRLWWQSLQKYFTALPATLYERMFSELRNEVEGVHQ
ncbi:hypothetical protein EXIGLDRAFT_764772 [Exidia glandulosa HHB12029]|uniref:Uncharacterized protein n=1 Tax=Exidia glandulosa HHB12029 TaxID=1314781 RepID=A0A165KWW4_EXIGL|nr:hypothetical protein EXIGLDRAFT_764772 [Exidia glandulosa HHB12029]